MGDSKLAAEFAAQGAANFGHPPPAREHEHPVVRGQLAMLIPYNTDASLYHPPFATVATIVLNVFMFLPVFVQDDPYDVAPQRGAVSGQLGGGEGLGQGLDDGDLADRPVERKTIRIGGTTVWRLLCIEFGKFRPWQWLTASYMHADIFHLLGNMFVLWGFGLVVEGKVGWLRFLVLYNLIGVMGWGFVQFMMLLASEGIGLGASLPIYGLIAITLIWAPENTMSCLFLLFFRPYFFETSIITLAAMSIALELAISGFHVLTATEIGVGLRLTSEILHLIGAFLGFATGIVMLRQQWVDCENQDLFSVWQGKDVKSTLSDDREDVRRGVERMIDEERRQRATAQSAPPPTPTYGAPAPFVAPVPDVGQQYVAEFRRQLAGGDLDAAWRWSERGESELLGWTLPEPVFLEYVQECRKRQDWPRTADAMYQYLARYHQRAAAVRLALAQILLQSLGRSEEAREVLSAIDPAQLKPEQAAKLEALRARLGR